MPPLEATPRHNWCHKKEQLRLLRDLRNWRANHFRWVDVYHIRSRSLLTITTNSGTNFLLLHRISQTGLFVNEGKSKKRWSGGRSGGRLSIQLSLRNGRIRMNR